MDYKDNREEIIIQHIERSRYVDIPQCAHPGCPEAAFPCRIDGEVYEHLCGHHAAQDGYCPGCGDFKAGCGDPWQDLCDNCESEIGDHDDEEIDADDFYSDEIWEDEEDL